MDPSVFVLPLAVLPSGIKCKGNGDAMRPSRNSTVPSPAYYLEEQSHLCKPSGLLPGMEPANIFTETPPGEAAQA